jgi:hypothetical protein
MWTGGGLCQPICGGPTQRFEEFGAEQWFGMWSAVTLSD